MIRILGATTALLLLAASPAAATGLIAHRGGAYEGISPTSLNAIAHSAELDVPTIEVDVRTTASNTLIAMHDATVDKTTDGTGPVIDKTAAQIEALHLDDGQGVPTILQVMNSACAKGLRIVLHLKHLTTESWTKLAARVEQCPGRTTVMGNDTQMDRAQGLVPGITRTIVLYFTAPDWPTSNGHDGVAVPEWLVTAADVDKAHGRDQLYWAYSPNTEDRWAAMEAAGVNAMFVDDVAGYLNR